MSAPGGPLGDFVRALTTLAPTNGEGRAAIAELFELQLGEVVVREAGESQDTRPASPAPRQDPDQSLEPEAVGTPADPGPSGPEETVDLPVPVDSQLVRVGRMAQAPPRWLTDARPLADATTGVITAPAPDPLLLPRWTPGILAAALSTAAPDGPVDTARVVEILARREPFDALPRLPHPTLRGGAQVLVDLAESMMPFLTDEVGLLRAIGRVMGADPVAVLRFAGCPSRGAGAGGRRTWARYETPLTPRPVVVITDLGLGGRPSSGDASTTAEWSAFARLVRRAGCPLVAFVPYRPGRVPHQLRRHLELIVWDRETTAASAARVVRSRRCQ